MTDTRGDDTRVCAAPMCDRAFKVNQGQEFCRSRDCQSARFVSRMHGDGELDAHIRRWLSAFPYMDAELRGRIAVASRVELLGIMLDLLEATKLIRGNDRRA